MKLDHFYEKDKIIPVIYIWKVLWPVIKKDHKVLASKLNGKKIKDTHYILAEYTNVDIIGNTKPTIEKIDEIIDSLNKIKEK